MADVVLDTSACFTFLENEAGADIVEAYLLDATPHREPACLSSSSSIWKVTRPLCSMSSSVSGSP